MLVLVLEFTMAQPPLFGRLMAFLVLPDDIRVIAITHAHLLHLLGGKLCSAHREAALLFNDQRFLFLHVCAHMLSAIDSVRVTHRFLMSCPAFIIPGF